MGNTLTAILPVIYEALDVVSRELVGFIPAVTRNSSVELAALNQTITYPIVPAITTENITPGATPADSGDQTIGSGSMTISKSKAAPIRWTGEEQKSLTVGDKPQLRNVMRDQFSQAFRVLCNEVEADLAALYAGASRAYGTAGTVPFGTAADLSDAAGVLKILDDNGAPRTDRHIVLGTTAMANVRGKQSVLFKVNEAGTEALLRQGIVGRLFGFDMHDSGQVPTKAASAASGAFTNNAGYAVGATSIVLAGSGSGSFAAGDVITFAGDSNKYVVTTGGTAVSGTIAIAQPGLRASIAASVTAITAGGAYAANMAFSRNAIHLVTRAPAMPDGGDDADDVMELSDPVSGLGFQVALYRQYRRIKYEVGLAWGVEMVKPEHAAILLG